MMGPNGKDLPVALGASASGERGGDRPEQITRDTGNVSAAPKVAGVTEPKEVEHVDVAPPAPPQIKITEGPVSDVSDEEIDQLHARFDQMETLIKRKLAIATLLARFDALQAWLDERFPN